MNNRLDTLATIDVLNNHIEDVRQVARDAISNLERAIDGALADARNTLADARNTIRQATEPTT